MVEFDAHRDAGKLDGLRSDLAGQVFLVRENPL